MTGSHTPPDVAGLFSMNLKPSASFLSSLSLFTLCARSLPSCCLVCSFDTTSCPTDSTVTDENYDGSLLRFNAVFVIRTKRKPHKNTTDVKAEVFFSPAVFFYAVAKGCIFQLLWNFDSDAKLGLHHSALRTQRKFRSLFLRFYQRFSKMK